MEESEYRELFNHLDPKDLVEVAIKMALDCDRLRRELDEANGVIR